MRILITAPWGERLGGAEAMLQGVFEGAAGSGHEIEPVFFQDGPWPQELCSAGLRVEVIEAGRLREAHRWATTVARLTRLMRQRRPDVILNWSAKTHLYGSPAAVLAGQSDRVVWWQQAIPARAWVDVTATLLPAVAIACYSGASQRAQAHLFPRRRTFAIAAGSPPPPEGQPAAAITLPDDVPIVGLVGRLQPWKNQDRLLRAQRILRDRGHRIHLLIVGGDSYGLSPEYASSLEPLARELGVIDDVTMTGEVPDAGPYIQRMDVLVNASDPEPFGIVILEGMARGVAVMAVNSGGPAEFVQDGATGVLARSGDPSDLADALQRLLESPQRRAEIAAAGRESYLADYTTAAMRRRFFDRMGEIAARAGG
ncbi:MAG TPA: glycosyltransferase [Solirubrobacteraceae bacterium]|nr:glycosyltransferase [Solirubrobacteraceae bacterium]